MYKALALEIYRYKYYILWTKGYCSTTKGTGTSKIFSSSLQWGILGKEENVYWQKKGRENNPPKSEKGNTTFGKNNIIGSWNCSHCEEGKQTHKKCKTVKKGLQETTSHQVCHDITRHNYLKLIARKAAIEKRGGKEGGNPKRGVQNMELGPKFNSVKVKTAPNVGRGRSEAKAHQALINGRERQGVPEPIWPQSNAEDFTFSNLFFPVSSRVVINRVFQFQTLCFVFLKPGQLRGWLRWQCCSQLPPSKPYWTQWYLLLSRHA